MPNGRKLPVFWRVRHDDLSNVHFDTRQYNHIVWENEKQLEEQLYLYVSALVGRGSAINTSLQPTSDHYAAFLG